MKRIGCFHSLDSDVEFGVTTHLVGDVIGGLTHDRGDQNRGVYKTEGFENRGFWWVVSDLEGDLDADELVKRVGTSLRVK